MKRTLKLITSLTLMLFANSAFAISPEDQSTYDGTGAAEIAQQEANQQGESALAKTQIAAGKLKAINEDIRKLDAAAREVGYFDGYMLMQDVIKGRKSKGTLEDAAGIKKMTGVKNRALKDLNEVLKKYESSDMMTNYMCQTSLKNLIQQVQSGEFLRTAKTAAKSIGAPETEQNSWAYTGNMWSNGHSKTLEDKIIEHCAK